MPERFGPWNSVFKRFDRWSRKGVWQRVFEALQDLDLEWLMVDATIIRAHVHAAGASKKAAKPPNSDARSEASAARFMRRATASGTR